MSNLDNEINATARQVSEIMASGYTRAEAMELIRTAAVSKIAGCVQSDYNNKEYFRIGGHMATYEQ